MAALRQENATYILHVWKFHYRANIKQEDIFPYLEFKDKYGIDKNMKRAHFKEAMMEIEKEHKGVKVIGDTGPIDGNDTVGEEELQEEEDAAKPPKESKGFAAAEDSLLDTTVDNSMQSIGSVDSPKVNPVTSRSGRKIKKRMFEDEMDETPSPAVPAVPTKRKALAAAVKHVKVAKVCHFEVMFFFPRKFIFSYIADSKNRRGKSSGSWYVFLFKF